MKIAFYNIRKTVWIIFAAGGCIALAGVLFPRPVLDVLVLFGCAVMVASQVFLIRLWKCPYCFGTLPLRDGHPSYCPSCGKSLEDLYKK